jgi:hypothetical protein
LIAPLLNSGCDVYSACLSKNENPNQSSFIIEELTDLVEEAVLKEFEAISERGGVLGAMETGYVADVLYQVPANLPTTDLTVFIRDVPLNLD